MFQKTVSIPFNQIYIPDHPFKTGEKTILLGDQINLE